jgi:hypothetical protein
MTRSTSSGPVSIWRYAQQRLRPRQTLPAIALVTAAAEAAAGWRGAATTAADAAMAAALVVTFRIWDDLADRAADAVAHPDRVSTRPASLRALVLCAAAIGGATAAIVWRWSGATAFVLLGALTAVLAAWYRLRTGRSAAGDHLRLLKYPVFAIVIAGGGVVPSARGALAIAVVYLAASVHEWWHDAASPVGRRTRMVEAVLLISATFTLAGFLEGAR